MSLSSTRTQLFLQQLTPSQLEDIAVLFRSRLKINKGSSNGYIQDRKYKLRTFPQCFLGSDAVTLLTEILQEQHEKEPVEVSCSQAVRVGQAIQEQFKIFDHVTGDHALKDEELFYRLLPNNLPGEVQATRDGLGNRLWDIMALLEAHIEVDDRVYHLRTYKRCFIGRDAVDTILELKLATDRASAVEYMLYLNHECNAFEHVTRDHSFSDAFLFFQFIPHRERMITYANGNHQVMTPSMATGMLQAEGGGGTAAGGRDTMDDTSRHTDDSISGSTTPSRSSDASSIALSTVMDSAALLHLLPPNMTLQDVADRLERDLAVDDYRYRFKVYKDCFVAQDCVTFLVQTGLASNRSRAELLGRQLEAHLNLFQHVTNGHSFRDKYYFFRFTPKSERKSPAPALTSSPEDTLDPTHSTRMSLRRQQEQQNQQPPPKRPVSGDNKFSILAALKEADFTLKDVADSFRKGIELSEHIYNLKIYDRAFEGPQAVMFLVEQGFAQTKSVAVLLGRIMCEKYHVFEHVGNADKPLVNCPLTVYQMTDEPIEDTTKKTDNIDDDERIILELPDGTKEVDRQLVEVAGFLQQGIKSKHHRYRGKLYRNTFIGSQAVDFLVNSSLAANRKDAVRLGRRVMHELKTFDHVTSDCDFADDYKFYRFEEHRISEESSNHGSFFRLSDIFDASESLMTGLGTKKTVGPKSVHSMSSTPDAFTDDLLGGDVFLPLEDLALEFRRNMKLKERRYLLSVYKNCFVGSEAVDYLVEKMSWASSRAEAVLLGQTLMRELNLFDHVTKAHTFCDSKLFYSFTDADEDAMRERLKSSSPITDEPLDSFGPQSALQLAMVARALEEGLTPRDNRFRLRVYKDTVIGSEIISYVVDSNLAATRTKALQLVHALCKQFMLFYHVTREHEVKDSNLFYRFSQPMHRVKGEWFKRLYGNQLRDKMITASLKIKDLSVSEYWDLVIEAIESDNFDLRISAVTDSYADFYVDSSDKDWCLRVQSFEHSIKEKSVINIRSSMQRCVIESVMASNAMQWFSAFIRLDPRQQIHRFFNEVAESGSCITIDALRPLFRFLPINLASVFTVWRPTSHVAIRRMMLGEAVGKGLDIKGKSSKRGKLSGYVPFLQINENKHKGRVRRLSPNHTVRVFYSSRARRARDAAVAQLELALMDMMETVEKAKKILASEKSEKKLFKAARQCMLLDCKDPTITPIDDLAPSCYGIEIPERLFWEAYFVRQDISISPGSIYDGGRPSYPAFQDMNFSALRSKPYDGAPRAVVYQNADRDDPLNPFELLMAYEENGRVLPVVSDFDCFLVGTRRVQYSEPLPADQVQVLHWCVRHIAKICEKKLAEQQKGKMETTAWSQLWLEVLKESTFHPEIPRFGFADPISYSIVENAVKRLSMTGAVRHGAECFNYYFPQELDSEFLFVGKNVAATDVPWKYVGVDELQDLLRGKIADGFCFPLNPKWILMDPGWMELYQSQIQSPHQHIQDAMKIWFPPESGLREDIERIYQLQQRLETLK